MNPLTTAASANEEISGAARPAARKKAHSRLNVSSRGTPSLNSRKPAAAISASKQLVQNSKPMSGTGQSVWS
jgi:hypothetical protein